MDEQTYENLKEEGYIMNEQIYEMIKEAREARENDDHKAQRLYSSIMMTDPNNGEAKFFGAYYSAFFSTQREFPMYFKGLCNIVTPSVELVLASAESEKMKLESITAICSAFIPYVNIADQCTVGTYALRERTHNYGFAALYALGDLLAERYPDDINYRGLYVSAWKEGVIEQQYLASNKQDRNLPLVYAEKVREFDASFRIPRSETGACFVKNSDPDKKR